MTQEKKIPGKDHIIDFSRDGSLIAVSGYDASAKVFDAKTLKLVFKQKLKGSKNQLPVYYQQISRDNRYYCFSCLWKIFVVDLVEKAIVKELTYSKDERLATIPFAINSSNTLYYPDGAYISVYDIVRGEVEQQIELPEQAGYADWMAVNDNGRFLAYKSHNHPLNKQVLIIDLENLSTRVIPLPADYVPGRSLADAMFWFVEDTDQIAVLRKGTGLSFFNYQTGEEIRTIDYEELGFRSLFHFYQSWVSGNGRYLLMNTEDSPDPDLNNWRVSVPDGFKFVVYGIETGACLTEVANGEHGLAFHPGSNKLAYIRVNFENHRRRQFLVVEDAILP